MINKKFNKHIDNALDIELHIIDDKTWFPLYLKKQSDLYFPLKTLMHFNANKSDFQCISNCFESICRLPKTSSFIQFTVNCKWINKIAVSWKKMCIPQIGYLLLSLFVESELSCHCSNHLFLLPAISSLFFALQKTI